MRVLQVCNVISPHQLPLARSIVSLVGKENFRFASTMQVTAERKALGWDADSQDPWILRSTESPDAASELNSWFSSADVVLCGERLWSQIGARINDRKLTFYISERWWKPPLGISRMLYPPFSQMAFSFRKLAQSPCLHYLAAGPYAASDIKRIAKFNERCWSWGYFVESPESLPDINRRKENEPLRVIWAGRMLPWKRVDILLRAFALAREKQNVHLTLIGNGPCEQDLVKLCARLGVVDFVSFLPSMPPLNVRAEMRKSHIYVLSSNAYEGWGAVVNEAMTEGCAVIASRESGAGRAVIHDGKNGALFASSDMFGLARLLIQYAVDEEKRVILANAGQKHINKLWSPAIAARRLLSITHQILDGKTPEAFAEGPMSKA